MSYISVKKDKLMYDVTIANPPLNLLSSKVMTEMSAALKNIYKECQGEVNNPKSAGGLVTIQSGVKGQFSFGLDPQELLATDVAGRKQVFLVLNELVKDIISCPLPTLAVVTGGAIAGGAVIAASCDFCAMQTESKISFSETKVNLALPEFIIKLFSQKTGGRGVFDNLILAKNISAEDAFNLGLADFIFTGTIDFEEWYTQTKQKLERFKPKVIDSSKQAFKKEFIKDIEKFAQNSGSFEEFLTDDYFGEGLRFAVSRMKS